MQPADTPDELVVHSDTDLLRKKFRTVLILNGVVLLISLTGIGVIAMLRSDTARYSVFVFILLAFSSTIQLVSQSYYWGGRLANSRPLRIDAWGVEFQSTAGIVRLPWEAVAQVRQRTVLRQSQLVFDIHPQAVPGQLGVEADPRTWPRFLKQGVAIGNLGLVPGFETILPAINHYSRGRVPIS